MDSVKVGGLIAKRRKEKSLTQKELAEQLNLSDKTVSKWECGLGCPDISVVSDLATVLELNITDLLSGEEQRSMNNMGNMKKTKFYVCPTCGNVVASTNELTLSCCGRKINELHGMKMTQEHELNIDYVEDELFVTVAHEMTKSHYISFVAYVTCNKLLVTKMYPEQNCETRFKKWGHGILYTYCSEHGLFYKYI